MESGVLVVDVYLEYFLCCTYKCIFLRINGIFLIAALHHLECHVDKECAEKVDQPLKPVYEPHSHKYEEGTEEYRKQDTVLQQYRLYVSRHLHHGEDHDEDE